MSQGIYIIANDKVVDHAIALLNSIRQYDPSVPVVLIPYDDHYHQVAQLLAQHYEVKLYSDLAWIETLSQKLSDSFGNGFFARPNQFRKQACWFGDFSEFLYIDTDIVVFEQIIDTLAYLNDYDFLNYDYQYKGGINNVFTPKILEEGILSEPDIQDIFNAGFWGAKKDLFPEQKLYDTFAECAQRTEYFDFSKKTSDMPIFNYMVLKHIPRRVNLVRQPEHSAGSWAGSPHFIEQEHRLFDPRNDLALSYLHWAGIRIQPGCSYWDIWQYYRNLNPELPSYLPASAAPKSWVAKVRQTFLTP